MVCLMKALGISSYVNSKILVTLVIVCCWQFWHFVRNANTPCFKKAMPTMSYLNNSVTNEPILIIFGAHNFKETSRQKHGLYNPIWYWHIKWSLHVRYRLLYKPYVQSSGKGKCKFWPFTCKNGQKNIKREIKIFKTLNVRRIKT